MDTFYVFIPVCIRGKKLSFQWSAPFDFIDIMA